MDVNSDTLGTTRSPQVVATSALARPAAHGTPVNLGPNFRARRFSIHKSADRTNPICPNRQLRFVRTKATRMDPQIFVVFVRTPVFSRTIFVRTGAKPSRSSCAQTPSSCAQQGIRSPFQKSVLALKKELTDVHKFCNIRLYQRRL
jgi:hypothetical protein